MKNEQRANVLHHVVRAVILLGLSIYIAFLVETDTLQLYIGVRIRPLVQVSSLVVYALAVIQAFIAYRTYKGSIIECDCCGNPPARAWYKSGFLYGMLALPLLLGFLLPDTVLGGAFASKKGIILGAAASPNAGANYSQQLQSSGLNDSEDAALPEEVPVQASDEQAGGSATPAEPATPLFVGEDEFEQELAILAERLYALPVIEVKTEIYMEILSSIVTFQEQFLGKEVELSGFVYREKGLSDNQLVVGRIAVQCCTADATPYGVLTEFAEASQFEDDVWVKLRGTLAQTEYNGNTIIKIDVTESEVIEAPGNPYIYPNFDFLNVSVP